MFSFHLPSQGENICVECAPEERKRIPVTNLAILTSFCSKSPTQDRKERVCSRNEEVQKLIILDLIEAFSDSSAPRDLGCNPSDGPKISKFALLYKRPSFNSVEKAFAGEMALRVGQVLRGRKDTYRLVEALKDPKVFKAQALANPPIRTGWYGPTTVFADLKQ